ncbi:MAG: hypothetical protein DLM50_03570 [Candidatus Meridianibacter frigidus]|nr:MAG: hypothetical protein DLM50_03570 [Candidatus Eremiobacteraeota bacterium]
MRTWIIFLFVLAGVGAGALAPGRFEHLFGTATLYVFLPVLLFEAAWNLSARQLLTWWRPIFLLAVPGVFITTAIVAIAVHFAGLPWTSALLIGAIISATDPVAIVATFKRAKVPESLGTIVQSESLLNDAMAVVLYRTILVITLLHSGAGVGLVVVETLAGVLGALALGIAAAYVLAMLVVRRNASGIQLAATITGAYIVYFAADIARASAIVAVIAFGVALREFERRSIVVDVALKVERVWDRLTFVSNVIIFFLTGAALEIGRLTHAPLVAVAALSGMATARATLAYVLTPWALGRIAPPGWLNVIRAAGARGALALALVIGLPHGIENRSTIIDVTLTLVLATLLLSAFSVPRAVRSLQPALQTADFHENGSISF